MLQLASIVYLSEPNDWNVVVYPRMQISTLNIKSTNQFKYKICLFIGGICNLGCSTTFQPFGSLG